MKAALFREAAPESWDSQHSHFWELGLFYHSFLPNLFSSPHVCVPSHKNSLGVLQDAALSAVVLEETVLGSGCSGAQEGKEWERHPEAPTVRISLDIPFSWEPCFILLSSFFRIFSQVNGKSCFVNSVSSCLTIPVWNMSAHSKLVLTNQHSIQFVVLVSAGQIKSHH